MYIGDFTKFTENYIKSIWRLEIGFWEENLEAENIRQEIQNQETLEKWLTETQETQEIILTEEEQIALETQKQEEFEKWVEQRKRFLEENPQKPQENPADLFWSDSD